VSLTPDTFASMMGLIYETVGSVFDFLDGFILIHSLIDFSLLDLMVSLEFLYLLVGFVLELRSIY
jgi:hypothetical protein